MKKQVLSVLVVCSLLLVVIAACNKVYTATPLKNFSTPLQALINSDTSLSYFYATVQVAGDSAMFGHTDSSIVIIPTNKAFIAAGFTLQSIHSLSAASADSLLRSYYISGPTVLITGSYNPYTNKLGNTIYGYGATDSTGSYFNGTAAINQKLQGSNATVLTINQFLSTTLPTIAQLIAADSSLTLFGEAVKQTGFNFAPSSGWNTILAPVDTAFIHAGYIDKATIDATDPTVLNNLLQMHLLPGQYGVQSFNGLSAVAAANSDSIHLSFSGGQVGFFTSDSSQVAQIITPNKIASGNIILHTISKVLTP